MPRTIVPAHLLPRRSILHKLGNAGGFTLNPATGDFRDATDGGFVVAGVQGNVCKVVPFASLTLGDILSAYGDNAEALSRPEHYFGGWVDRQTGLVYLECSQVVATERRALTLAAERRELAVWDLANARELRAA